MRGLSTFGASLFGMKRALVALVVATLGAIVAAASVAYAGPRLTDTSQYHYEVLCGCATCQTDAGAIASTSATIPAGEYLVAVYGENVNMCTFDAGCAASGQFLPLNTVMRQNFYNSGTGGTPTSCRSANADGGLSLTLVTPGT